jgi:hypothetical protein
MQELTPEGLRIVEGIAQAHAVSTEAVIVLLRALAAGNGTQAQFNHPDLGGMGQWSQGGMIMIGDMFNQGLKYKVGALCDALSGLLRSQPLFAPAPSQTQSQNQGGGAQDQRGGASLFVSGAGFGQAWPAELGVPSSTGAQNDLAYAFFPATRRLAIRQGGQTRIYDAGDHQIGGFSQQQGGDQSLTFTSQFGIVRVADLPVVAPAGSPAAPAAPVFEPEPSPEPVRAAPQAATAAPGNPASQSPSSHDDIFSALERLADLRQKDILTEQEFSAKKAELLSRL